MKIFSGLEKIAKSSIYMLSLLAALSCSEGSSGKRPGTGIVYSSDRGAESKIFINDTEGNEQQVTSGSGKDYDPVLSPRGEWVAFAREAANNSQIYRVKPDGSGLEQITFGGGNKSHPAWSPNGKKVAYQEITYQDAFGDYFDIISMDLHTYAATNLTNTATEREEEPSYGLGEVVYAKLDPNPTGDKYIYAISDNGTGAPEQLTATFGYKDASPAFSRDRTKIIFSRQGWPPTDIKIWIMDRNDPSNSQTRLTPTADPTVANWHPSLSPDNELFAYVAIDSDGDSEIYAMNLKDNTIMKLTNNIFDEESPFWGFVRK